MKNKVCINRVIVIGADHYNTLWLIRSLGLGGFYVIAIIINPDSNRSFVSKTRYCKESYIVRDYDEMIHLLCSLSLSSKIPVFASGDVGAVALDESYNLLSQKYILHHCNYKQGGIKYWMDKANMLAMAEECGFTIPYSQEVDLNKEVIDYESIPYPCLVKPEVSAEASKNAFKVCNDAKQLCHSISELKEICPRIVIQEYIQRDYEYLVYGASTKDDVILPGGLTKVHNCSDTKNLGMTSYAYLSDEIPIQLGRLDLIHKFIRDLGYYGLFSVEFMITKDKAYFLEINLRNDGTCYFTTQAGCNIPALWAASVLEQNMSELSKKLKRSRTYGINEINYIKYTLRSQSLYVSIKELFRAKAFSMCKWNDMVPVFTKIFYSLRTILMNKLSSKRE